jgi:hypothetical protein
MSTSTARKPRVKPARFISLLANGLVHIAQGHNADLYTLQRVEADYGVAFRICKADDAGAETADPYHVHFDAETGDSCDCLGFLKHRHCKHCDGLKALLAAGKLS